MSATGLPQFDETLHLANSWLKDVMEAMGWDDRAKAYRAVRTTLHALRDRLTVDDGAHLAAQLPLIFKGTFYEGWKPAACGGGERSLEAFLEPVADAFDRDPRVRPLSVVRAVFAVMARHVSEGEIAHVLHALPQPIRDAIAEDH